MSLLSGQHLKVIFNPSKSESIFKINPSLCPPIELKDNLMNEVIFQKHLGIYLQEDCPWNRQTDEIVNIAKSMIYCLKF